MWWVEEKFEFELEKIQSIIHWPFQTLLSNVDEHEGGNERSEDEETKEKVSRSDLATTKGFQSTTIWLMISIEIFVYSQRHRKTIESTIYAINIDYVWKIDTIDAINIFVTWLYTYFAYFFIGENST